MIGAFGDIIFEVSNETLRTFNNFSKNKKIRLATFDILDGTQKVQYLGEALNEIEFTVKLDARYINVEEEIEKLERMQQQNAYRLVVGGKNMGLFSLEEVNETYKFVDNKGRILGAEISLKLKEYK